VDYVARTGVSHTLRNVVILVALLVNGIFLSIVLTGISWGRGCKACALRSKSKAVPLHAMEAHEGRGGIAPTHS
jgi:hypothetical protein